jgi:hypothetical protein
MKCLSMQVERLFMSGYGMTPGMFYVKEHCPQQAVDGITMPAETRQLRLGAHMLVNISPELLQVGFSNGAVAFDRNNIVIHRASVRLGKDGFFELIPERENDKDGALCFFDVGTGGYSCVEYATDKHEVIARGVTESLPFVGYETVALVAMQPGSSVQANRYAKRWLIFGESILRETLSYLFDGKTLSLQNPTPRR